MDCYETIMERRSIRSYKSTPIPREILNSILEAALMAPSAVNLQPWYYVVIESNVAMTKLKDIMGQVSTAIEPNLAERFPKHPEVVRETSSFVRGLGNAPVCILVFQYKKDYNKTGGSIHQSIAAANENLLLAAWTHGIGSCWLTAPIEASYGTRLEAEFAPEHGEFTALITLGYPEKIPPAPRRKDGRVLYL